MFLLFRVEQLGTDPDGVFFEHVEVLAEDRGDAGNVTRAYDEARAEGSAIDAVEPVTERRSR